MNLSDIKNLISEIGGKVVFVENDKVVGVFLSYDEYRKIAAQKNCSCPAPKLPLFTSGPEEEPAGFNVPEDLPSSSEEPFDVAPADIVAEEPEVIIAPAPARPVSHKPDLIYPGPEKELTVDDLPF
ncbi:MAG: hypothetical protein PHU56_02930 [Candidatus Pacebacteria bacterium]|nr:hypothetical protein [Candidatus Paceibacterota bacterium]